MKQTFLVFLLTLFLCGSVSAYSVNFDPYGSSNFSSVKTMNLTGVSEGNPYNEYENHIFSYQDMGNGLFTESFTQKLNTVQNEFGAEQTVSSQNIYFDINLNGQFVSNSEIYFTGGDVIMYKDSDNNQNFDLGDSEIAKLTYKNSLISELSGSLVGTNDLSMKVDIGFSFDPGLNPLYWGPEDSELADKTWLFSMVGSRINQQELWAPFDAGVGEPGENDYMIAWNASGSTVEFEAVPEPSTMILLGLGLLGLAGIGRRKLKN